jgi:hypothetical protein
VSMCIRSLASSCHVDGLGSRKVVMLGVGIVTGKPAGVSGRTRSCTRSYGYAAERRGMVEGGRRQEEEDSRGRETDGRNGP